MSKLRDAAQQALEALEFARQWTPTGSTAKRILGEAVPALRAALAEPEPDEIKVAWLAGYTEGEKEAWSEKAEQEPVAWIVELERGGEVLEWHADVRDGLVFGVATQALYTAPQPAKATDTPCKREALSRFKDVTWATCEPKKGGQP